jgi:hypothetical protein
MGKRKESPADRAEKARKGQARQDGRQEMKRVRLVSRELEKYLDLSHQLIEKCFLLAFFFDFSGMKFCCSSNQCQRRSVGNYIEVC